MADADYERVLCVKNEVFVYRIPARTSNRGYRAADWTLDKPDWTGRLRVVSKARELFIKLDDQTTGELFASCGVESYPSIAVEQVLDSSRYFVIRIQDGHSRSAFIGIGFADRGDSFDLLVSLQDHFKGVKREDEQQLEATKMESAPRLDLGFKEGQTIKLNLSTNAKARVKAHPAGRTSGLLPPPPPGGATVLPPPANTAPPRVMPPVSTTPSSSSSSQPAGNTASLLDLDGPTADATSSLTAAQQWSGGGGGGGSGAANADPWGDFTSASNSEANNGVTDSKAQPWISFN